MCFHFILFVYLLSFCLLVVFVFEVVVAIFCLQNLCLYNNIGICHRILCVTQMKKPKIKEKKNHCTRTNLKIPKSKQAQVWPKGRPTNMATSLNLQTIPVILRKKKMIFLSVSLSLGIMEWYTIWLHSGLSSFRE